MLLGEQNKIRDAEQAFRKVLELDPNSAAAAYNLGVILATRQPAEAVRWCGKAYKLQPDEPKYGYTYAFYLYQNAKQAAAIANDNPKNVTLSVEVFLAWVMESVATMSKWSILNWKRPVCGRMEMAQ